METTEATGREPGARVGLGDVLVGAILAGIVVWRLAVFATHVEPVGVDMANWVRTYRSWWGPVDIDDVLVPPVAPLVAGVTNEVLDLRWTSHLLMSVSSVAPAVGAWIVVRTRASSAVGIVAVVAIALASSTIAAMAWGGLPQLLGLGALLVFADRVDRFAAEPDRRRALVAGAWFAVLAATSALVLVAGAVIAGSMVAATVLRHGWKTMALVAWLALPSLPLVPLYLVTLSRLSISDDAATTVGARAALETVLGPTRWPWILVLGVGIYGLVRRVAQGGWRACVFPTVLVAGAALPMITGEVRFAYVLPAAVIVAVVLVIDGTPVGAHGVLALALIAVTIPAAVAQRQDIDEYAQLVPDGVGEGIAWLESRSNVEGPVLVPPVNGAPFGWMVEAAGIDALVASRDDWLFFPEERAAADDAVRLLSGRGWPTERDLARIAVDGIDWVFVPVAWGGHDDGAVDALERGCPDRVPYRSDSVIVLRTDDPCDDV